jgi:hypothetical protein
VAAPARRPSTVRHPWRVAIVAIALVAVVNLGVILIATSDTSDPDTSSLPSTVEAVRPGSGELTGLVDDVMIDLRDDLTGVLVINGTEIPEDQLDVIEELGIVSFRPGPDKELTKLHDGVNTVVAYYWPRTEDRPEQLSGTPSHGWTFRAGA